MKLKIVNSGFHRTGTQYATISTPLGTAYDTPQQHADALFEKGLTWDFPTINQLVGTAIVKNAQLDFNIEPIAALFVGQSFSTNLTMLLAVRDSLALARTAAASVSATIKMSAWSYPVPFVGGQTLDFNQNYTTVESNTPIRGAMCAIIANIDYSTLVLYRQGESLSDWKTWVSKSVRLAEVTAGFGKPMQWYINMTRHGPGNGIQFYPYHPLWEWVEMLAHLKREALAFFKKTGRQVKLRLWDGWHFDSFGNWIWNTWKDGEEHFQEAEQFHEV